MGSQPKVGTGSRTLDHALDGGYPEDRATLLTGTPGTGKSTLAMQFLQKGLDEGDDCLFVSTEQTFDELRSGFGPFPFDLDHENLTITTVHASPGKTLESDDPELTLQSLEGDEDIPGEEFGIPFTGDRIREYLERFAPCDRVVFDSVSGLKMVRPNDVTYRREILDLIRSFADEFEATALLTAEFTGSPDPSEGVEAVATPNAVQFNAHGVIRLWRENVDGDFHRFLDVMKMRGADHDTRRYEIEIGDEGVAILPRRRFHSPKFIHHPYTPTGLDGLDDLCGGGLLTGTGTLLEHDGKANFDVLLSRLFLRALNEGKALTLIPTVEMNKRRVEQLLSQAERSIEELLDQKQLFIIDMIGAWGADHDGVFDVQREEASLRYILERIEEESPSEGQFYALNTEAKVHGIGRDEAREFRYWLEANFIGPDDTHLDIHNPNLMKDELAAFYVDAAGQVLRTWMDESGLQYLKLKKSPIGSVGSTRLVEYLHEDPFVRIQRR